MSNLDVQDVDLIKGSTAMFLIRNYGSLTITNGTVSNVNVNAYNLETSSYSYVGSNGGVFSFLSVTKNNSLASFAYTVTNITFTKLYGTKGSAFYFGTESTGSQTHEVSVALSTITVQNCYSYTNGVVAFVSGGQNVTITGSTFSSNTGVNGEADMKIASVGSLTVSNTTFTLFTSSGGSSDGSSVTFGMSTPFAFTVQFTSVIVKCSNIAFDDTTYKGYLANSATALAASAPINIDLGKLTTSSCTFSN
mmetsp:Transcript_42050/g.48767  ORF Transcript_42050/g.48767 Transcript_42050/m.48767 type:complete len:250 (-) Transcript_42050:2913-3662(-)